MKEKDQTPGEDRETRWNHILDTFARVIAAGGIVGAAFIANNYQSSMTVSNLLSQREQADSALRADMFSDLIGPLTRYEKDLGKVTLDRQLLLIQLLALNFHEHFELKPLMLHLDHYARNALESIDINPNEGTVASIREVRKELRSVGKRVSRAQVALLTNNKNGATNNTNSKIYNIALVPEEFTDDKVCIKQENGESIGCANPAELLEANILAHVNELKELKSPNQKWKLTVLVMESNWKEESFKIHVRVTENKPNKPDNQDKKASVIHSAPTDKPIIHFPTSGEIDQSFTLTHFDFPFTDNTLLADGTRFSIVIDRVDQEAKRANFKLIWFPKDYFSARERPVNYGQFRDKLFLSVP